MTTTSLAKGEGTNESDDQGYTSEDLSRKYYGPEPDSGTHSYDILIFGIDQTTVDISSYTSFDQNLMNNIYSAYSNRGVTTVTIGSTDVQIISKGKITGKATP